MPRILLCNDRLRRRSGTEIVTRDLARGFHLRGMDVAVFTEKTGSLADELGEIGVSVTTSVKLLPWQPDVIHANHPDAAAPLFSRFPATPAIVVCHDPHRAFCSQAYSNIVGAFGVSNECRKRAATDLRISLADVGSLPNAVDTRQILVRDSLPDRPTRWLFVAEKHGSRELLPIIRRAASRFDAEIEAVGPRAPVTVPDLPAHAAKFDLIIASARSALESCAAGAAVCVGDPRGFAGLLTRQSWARWKDDNLGWGILNRPFDEDALGAAVAEFDPREAEATTALVRLQASLDQTLDHLLQIYREAKCVDVVQGQLPSKGKSLLRRVIGA